MISQQETSVYLVFTLRQKEVLKIHETLTCMSISLPRATVNVLRET